MKTKRKQKSQISYTFCMINTCIFFVFSSILTNVQGGEPKILSQLPRALRGAKLLFHTPQGLYLKVLGQEQKRELVSKGYYGRWSPNGDAIAYFKQNQVFLYDLERAVAVPLALAPEPMALAFHPNGQEIFFSDEGSIKSVDITSKNVSTIYSESKVVEFDIAPNGKFLAATLKEFGYQVHRIDLPAGTNMKLARGCSASASPDNRWIMSNARNHDHIVLLDSASGEVICKVQAPDGYRLDNQKWSNHANWIAGVIENHKENNIMIQSVSDQNVWQVELVHHADRPDIFIPPQMGIEHDKER